MTIKIDQKFKNLLPPLTSEQQQGLEQDLLKHGCLEYLITWNGTLIDGHHRYDICQKHGISFEIKEMQFSSELEAMYWAWGNQKNRRNLSAYESGKMALMFEPLFREQAKERIVAGKKIDPTQNSAGGQKGETRDKIAEIAGLSHNTIDRIKAIETSAPTELKQKLAKQEISINQAYKQVKADQKKNVQKQKIEQVKNNPLPVNIKLLEGDLFDKIDNVENSSIDLLITDPPYNMNKDKWDRFDNNFLEFTKSWLMKVKEKLKDNFNMFITFNSDYFCDLEYICRSLNLPIKSRLIWHYRNAGGKSMGKYCFSRTYEPILHIGNKSLNFDDNWNDERFDVWTIAVPQSNFNEGKYHPTQKPLELFERLIKIGSFVNDQILDCFAGSGTTGIICKKLNRNCILIEKEQEYIDIIKGRINAE